MNEAKFRIINENEKQITVEILVPNTEVRRLYEKEVSRIREAFSIGDNRIFETEGMLLSIAKAAEWNCGEELCESLSVQTMNLLNTKVIGQPKLIIKDYSILKATSRFVFEFSTANKIPNFPYQGLIINVKVDESLNEKDLKISEFLSKTIAEYPIIVPTGLLETSIDSFIEHQQWPNEDEKSKALKSDYHRSRVREEALKNAAFSIVFGFIARQECLTNLSSSEIYQKVEDIILSQNQFVVINA